MKRSLLKKIGIVGAGVVMSLAMGATAFAAETPMTIEKEIAAFNPQSAIEINYPAVEYTYSIAPANPGSATVNDGKSAPITVKQGVDGAVTMGNDNKATFAAGSVAASPTGTLLKDTFGIQVDPAKFPAAGVYRYALTEAAPENLANLGYEKATDSVGTRYLDVYIVNEGGGLEVQSLILFYGEATTSLSEENASAKTSGFVSEADGDYSGDTFVDKYKTYNAEISKTVTGGLGDKTNLFPINASVAAGANASDVVIPASIKTNTSGNATAANITLASGAAEAAVVANLADGDIAQLIGIPVGSTLNISETNNTADTYQVTTDGLDPALSGVAVASGATSDAGSVTTAAVETKAVGFTNNLDQISPTNVVLRFAPYLFILGAAIILLLVMRRRKSKDDE